MTATWSPPGRLAGKIGRAASSVAANLAASHGSSDRDRLHVWRTAHGSATKGDSHLRLLAAAGGVDRSMIAVSLHGFKKVPAMTWRLLDPEL